MPNRKYSCKSCGTNHHPPTGDNCPYVLSEQEEEVFIYQDKSVDVVNAVAKVAETVGTLVADVVTLKSGAMGSSPSISLPARQSSPAQWPTPGQAHARRPVARMSQRRQQLRHLSSQRLRCSNFGSFRNWPTWFLHAPQDRDSSPLQLRPGYHRHLTHGRPGPHPVPWSYLTYIVGFIIQDYLIISGVEYLYLHLLTWEYAEISYLIIIIQ